MYKVIFSESSEKDLKKLDRDISTGIIKKIFWFSERDRIWSFCKKIKGKKGLFRLRVGKYRIVFCFDKNENKLQIMFILRVLQRKEVYKENGLS